MVRLLALVAALLVVSLSAQTDLSMLPRLQLTDLQHVGAWRLPSASINGQEFGYGGQAIAFNPDGPSMFVSNLHLNVAEVTVPTPVKSANIADLPVAAFKQGFTDPTEGRWTQVHSAKSASRLSSMVVHNGRLYGTASIYYDATNDQRVSHFSRSLNLNTPSFQGWSQVWETAKTGFVSGSLAIVPDEWQATLGGQMASGQCCIPIISRTSFGPSAFAFNPSLIGQPVVPALPLLYYPSDHPTLGQWLANSTTPNPTFNLATEIGGLVMVPGTRSALYFGRTGLGPACYGGGTADLAKVGTTEPDGTYWCHDPTSSSKGGHAYPYEHRIYAYDLNDFAAVRAGTKQPWEVVPYGQWPLPLPFPQAQVQIGGVSFDATKREIHISQLLADPLMYQPQPIMHVLRVAVGAPPPPPTNTTPPTPDPPPPPTEPTVEELKAQLTLLQTQVADLSAKFAIAQADLATAKASLTSTTTARDAALARIAAIKVEAKAILDRNATLKPNSRLPNWVTSALNNILTK